MKKKILIALLFCMVKVEAQTSTFSVIDSLSAKGRYKLALTALEKINPPSFLSNYKKAVIYESIDNFKKTAQFLEEALVFKEDYQANLKLAKAYQRLKKSDKSIKIYEHILEKDSLNLVLEYQLGKLYLASKKSEEAISLFKDLITKDSLNANYSYQLGLAFAQVNDRDRMINSFIDTFKKDSAHIKAIAHLASSFYKLQEKDSTALFVEKGLVLDENHINLNRIKINNYYQNKKYTEALPYLLKLDSLQKMEFYNNSMLGKVYYNLEEYNEAKKYFKNLSKIEREDFKGFTYLGHIAMKEKEYRVAELYYRRATLTGNVKKDEEYFGLATMFYETEKPKLAIENFSKALEENYINYNALFQLAKLTDGYYKDKKIAYKHYKKFLERFYDRDITMTKYAESRVEEIKADYFLKGETLK